jgi:Ca2+-binding EF-hand superfamily protein
VFKKFDKDGSGSIDIGELKAALKMIEIDVSEEKLTELLTQIDENNDGTIDL